MGKQVRADCRAEGSAAPSLSPRTAPPPPWCSFPALTLFHHRQAASLFQQQEWLQHGTRSSPCCHHSSLHPHSVSLSSPPSPPSSHTPTPIVPLECYTSHSLSEPVHTQHTESSRSTYLCDRSGTSSIKVINSPSFPNPIRRFMMAVYPGKTCGVGAGFLLALWFRRCYCCRAGEGLVPACLDSPAGHHTGTIVTGWAPLAPPAPRRTRSRRELASY